MKKLVAALLCSRSCNFWTAAATTLSLLIQILRLQLQMLRRKQDPEQEDFDGQREQEESEDRLNDKLPVEEKEQDRREIESEVAKEPETAAFMTDQEFINWFLGVNHVTIGYRWTSVREGQLVGALVEKKMRTQARTMIDKIKAHLTVLAAAPNGE